MTRKVARLGLSLPLACVIAAGIAVPAGAQTAAPAAPPKATEAALPDALTLIDRHIEATGGKAALKALSSVNARGSISVPANGMSGTIEMFAARPNKALVRTSLAGIGELSEGFDGKVGWSMNPMTGPMLSTGEELAQKAFDSDFDRGLGLASRYESIKTIEKTTFEGRPVYKVQLTRKGGGDDFEFYDVETGLKAGMIVTRQNPMGSITVTSAVKDYKKFGPILQAATVTQTVQGVQMVTTFTSIEYDKVDPAVFELPAQIKALVK